MFLKSSIWEWTKKLKDVFLIFFSKEIVFMKDIIDIHFSWKKILHFSYYTVFHDILPLVTIFYTDDILMIKIDFWSFLSSEMSEKICKSTFQAKITMKNIKKITRMHVRKNKIFSSSFSTSWRKYHICPPKIM